MLAESNKIDVLIVCALKDEYDQLLRFSDAIDAGCWNEKALPNGRLVADAIFNTQNNRTLSVRATWCSFMGREEASALVNQMMSETSFRCLAMTGICAGRRGKVELGDVIFADRLWSYDAGKIIRENGKEVFQGDMLQYRPRNTIVQRMQNTIPDINSWPIQKPLLSLEQQELWVMQCIYDDIIPHEQPDFDTCCPDWPDVIKRLLKKELATKSLSLTVSGREHVEDYRLMNPKGVNKTESFSLHIAPIATGVAVVEDSTIFDKLSSSMRKVIGIDMEASALGAIGEVNDIPVIIAKAVCDFGDEFKDDRYRHFASQASARTMMQFLLENADLFAQDQHIVTDDYFQDDLLELLAEEYPEITQARALWKRAGGKNNELASNPYPRDMWLNIWNRSLNGASVTPTSLLLEVKKDYPENKVVIAALKKHSDS